MADTRVDEPAFPATTGITKVTYIGLTKREWFTGMALTGVMAMRHQIVESDSPKNIAEDCVKAADAVLERLAK